MHTTADPSRLEAFARQVRQQAEQLRTQAGQVVAAAEAMDWESLSARSFRHDVEVMASAMRRGADRLDDAGTALHRQAAGIRRTEAMLSAGGKAVESAVGAGVHLLTGLGG